MGAQNYLLGLKTQSGDFCKFQEDIFKLIHYLYEDLKLNVLSFATHGIQVAKLLTKWIIEIGQKSQASLPFSQEASAEFLFSDNQEPDLRIALRKVGYIDHYTRDFPQLKSLYKQELKFIYGDINQTVSCLLFSKSSRFVKIEKVPDIMRTLESIQQSK